MCRRTGDQRRRDTAFETLVARIVADYATAHDPDRETAWVAEIDGRRTGCVFCVADDDPAAGRFHPTAYDPLQWYALSMRTRVTVTVDEAAVHAAEAEVAAGRSPSVSAWVPRQ